jgi:hypothetical protein
MNKTFDQHAHEDALMAKLQNVMESFYFEANDDDTREEVARQLNEVLNQDVAVREHHVICDESNNTPSRQGELWADVAVKMTWGEDAFIHMALRVKNQ